MIDEIEENEEVEENEENEEVEEATDVINERQKEIKKLEEEIKQKEEDHKILYDKYLRVNAEYDNFRKRTAKEKEGIYSDAAIDVLKYILPVLDNIGRAVQFCDTSDPEKVFEGFKIIYSQFLGTLEKIGVEEIKAEGEQFDPEFHNAVMHEENDGYPDNTITEVMQKGYTKGDRVIRPSMVKVVN
jgi:molecular chaperone GrpE